MKIIKQGRHYLTINNAMFFINNQLMIFEVRNV